MLWFKSSLKAKPLSCFLAISTEKNTKSPLRFVLAYSKECSSFVISPSLESAFFGNSSAPADAEILIFCPSSLVISPANIMGFPASSQITLPLHSTHTYSPIRFLALYWHSCRGFVPENTPEISSLYNALSSGWICCSQIVAASSRYSPDKPKYSTEALDHREIFVFISHT